MNTATDIRPGDDPVEVSNKLIGRTRTRLLRELFDFFGLPHETIKHIFRDLYTRDVLTQRERELCAVAALCVLSRENELKSHIIAAVRAGATKQEIAEVILQMSTYGGMPVCIDALAVARQVFARPSDKSADQ